jgi:hypothetical protein
MKIVGCDLHARQQTIAMVDTETGEFTETTLGHEGNAVRAFYAALEGRVVVGIEATGAMQWFLELLETVLRKTSSPECETDHEPETPVFLATGVASSSCDSGARSVVLPVWGQSESCPQLGRKLQGRP